MRGLIGLDWGTSSLRAMRFGEDGRVCEERHRPWGIRHLPQGGFATALIGICDDWPALPLLAAGMVGSRQGWCEAPYVDAPADAAALAAACIRIDTDDGRTLAVVPGVRDASGPDLMRGEETQIVGALALRPELGARSDWLLPGTHSKWVQVRDGRIAHLHTAMTGELFAVLRTHSILGAGLDADAAPGRDDAAFDAGVQAARESGAAGAFARLFSVRAQMLEGHLPAASVPDYLSGLLIGEDLRSALAAGWLDAHASPLLVGDAALCARYRRAFALLGLVPPEHLADAAAHGLWRIAETAQIQDTTA